MTCIIFLGEVVRVITDARKNLFPHKTKIANKLKKLLLEVL